MIWSDQLLKEISIAETQGVLSVVVTENPYHLVVRILCDGQEDVFRIRKFVKYIESITIPYFRTVESTAVVDFQTYRKALEIKFIFSNSLSGDDLDGMVPCDGREITKYQYPGVFDAIDSFQKRMYDSLSKTFCVKKEETESKDD